MPLRYFFDFTKNLKKLFTNNIKPYIITAKTTINNIKDCFKRMKQYKTTSVERSIYHEDIRIKIRTGIYQNG